jgi:hypothetical protein
MGGFLGSLSTKESDLISMMNRLAQFSTNTGSSGGGGGGGGDKTSSNNQVDVLIDGSAGLFRQHQDSLSDEMLRTVLGTFSSSGGISDSKSQMIDGSGGYLQYLDDESLNINSNSLTSAPSSSSSSLIFGNNNETEELLGSLDALEAQFCAKSFESILKPVEQMFPSMEGYTNAIPSKHDVIAFMRIIQVISD